MTLAKVTTGKQQQPHRILLYGTEGIGKSTFGAGAPKPIFLPVEQGSHHLDVARFPKPEGWKDVLEAVRTLTVEAHDYQTLVIDTVDAAEALLWRFMIDRDQSRDRNGKPKLVGITDYGFGKGFDKALDEWRVLLKALETLQAQRGLHVIILGHSFVKTFKNPEGEDFDRYELKLHAKAAGLMKEWTDCVFFAQLETFAKRDEATKRVRGIDSGTRLLRVERRAAFDAKNRFGLTESVPLSWADFDEATKREVDIEALTAEMLRKAKELGPEFEAKVTETVTKAAGHRESLININNRINMRLAEKAAQESEG
jgi:hypothetical protein